MLNFVCAIVLVGIGGKMLITPAVKLKEQYPKMRSTKAAKIAGGFVLVIGIGIIVLQICMWMGKI